MKKLLSCVLAFVLALSLLPAAASAEGSASSDGTPAANLGSAASALSFTDVASGAWYYNAVQYAVQNGLVEGASKTLFAPARPMTKAVFTAALYRLGGSKKTEYSVTFTDVAASAWYRDAVQWATTNGIASGCGNGVFGAENNLTRQQMAVMLYRFAKYMGRRVDAGADLSAYPDASAIAAWAQKEMSWAVLSGLITGSDHQTLSPEGYASRAQATAVLLRYTNGVTFEKRTSDYVAGFIKGSFDRFYEDGSDSLRALITKDALLEGWNSVISVSGAPGESLGCIYARQNGNDIVVSYTAGLIYNIKVIITYGSDGKPIGIWTSRSPKNPPEPQTSAKWEEVPVTVGDHYLPGMLTLPKGVQKPPVVILVQGSGASDMNEAFGTAPNRPFQDIARGLAEQGVATLRYNKRTYQYPTVGCDSIAYEVLDDASAAVKLLAADGRVDTNRIYLLGHSLGGMMAPKIAADNAQIKGFISMAGSLRTLQEISLDQCRMAIEAESSLTEQQKKDAMAQTIAENEKTKTLNDGGTGVVLGIPTKYWASLNAINSKAIIKGLDVPMLILQGSADFQVYADKDYKLWQTALAGRDNVTFKLYDGLSHLFMPNQIPANGEISTAVYMAPNHVSPQVITDIATWVNTH